MFPKIDNGLFKKSTCFAQDIYALNFKQSVNNYFASKTCAIGQSRCIIAYRINPIFYFYGNE